MSKVYIDTDELAVRIAEACMGVSRPAGSTAADALSQMGRVAPEIVPGFHRAAKAVTLYIAECVNAEHPGQIEVAEVTVERSSGIQ